MAAKSKRSVQLREEHRERLREALSARNNVNQIFDSIEKLENLTLKLTQVEVARLDKSIDKRLRVLDHYLPKLKAIEVEGAIDVSQTIAGMSTAQLKERAIGLIKSMEVDGE